LLSDSTRSWTRRAQESLNLGSLTPQSQATLAIISTKITEGYKAGEIAAQYGKSASWASELQAGLRCEIFAQMGLLQPLSPADSELLAESIATDGIKIPILVAEVDGHPYMVDGWERWIIACDLGMSPADVPAIYLGTLERSHAKSLTFMVNAARRHLTRDDRKALAESEIMDNPHLSDRAIAAICGISPTTVAAYRGKIADDQKTMATLATAEGVQTGHLPEKPHVDVYPPERVGRDGSRQIASAPAPPAAKPEARPPEFAILYCPHCRGAVSVRDGGQGRYLAKA
jgi:hypothetical protein